jgi:hypothetical protein
MPTPIPTFAATDNDETSDGVVVVVEGVSLAAGNVVVLDVAAARVAAATGLVIDVVEM